MHTEKRHRLLALDEVRRTDVGRQHTFFDETVRIVVISADDGFNKTFLPRHYLGFLRFEVNRPAPVSGTAQRFKKIVENVDVFNRTAAGKKVFRITVNRLPRRGIREARVRMNEPGVELVSRCFPLG